MEHLGIIKIAKIPTIFVTSIGCLTYVNLQVRDPYTTSGIPEVSFSINPRWPVWRQQNAKRDFRVGGHTNSFTSYRVQYVVA